METIVFIDGQNLYHLVKGLWASLGDSKYTYPSYDVERLAQTLTSKIPGRTLAQVRFYTGVPDSNVNAFWHGFWTNKLRYLRSRGVVVYAGRVNPSGHEKGVDVSLAVNLVRLTYERRYDAAIIVSQDHDFGPAIRLARDIAQEQGRVLTFESCFPYEPSSSSGSRSGRGIPGTTWVHIDRATYDSCIDPRDYRIH